MQKSVWSALRISAGDGGVKWLKFQVGCVAMSDGASWIQSKCENKNIENLKKL